MHSAVLMHATPLSDRPMECMTMKYSFWILSGVNCHGLALQEKERRVIQALPSIVDNLHRSMLRMCFMAF